MPSEQGSLATPRSATGMQHDTSKCTRSTTNQNRHVNQSHPLAPRPQPPPLTLSHDWRTATSVATSPPLPTTSLMMLDDRAAPWGVVAKEGARCGAGAGGGTDVGKQKHGPPVAPGRGWKQPHHHDILATLDLCTWPMLLALPVPTRPHPPRSPSPVRGRGRSGSPAGSARHHLGPRGSAGGAREGGVPVIRLAREPGQPPSIAALLISKDCSTRRTSTSANHRRSTHTDSRPLAQPASQPPGKRRTLAGRSDPPGFLPRTQVNGLAQCLVLPVPYVDLACRGADRGQGTGR
jgi:hypothetical protein